MSGHCTEIHSNFPIALMLGLRDTFGLQRFVETGTCWGGTASLAALAFPRVDTVEIMPERHQAAVDKFAGCPNVICHLGDSREFVAGHDWPDMPPTLIYLDAHWPVGEFSYSPGFEAPLESELKSIGSLHGRHCIVVDDIAPEHFRPKVQGWDCHIFGTEQFCVMTPQACEYEGWLK